jgi:hypothetical protein
MYSMNYIKCKTYLHAVFYTFSLMVIQSGRNSRNINLTFVGHTVAPV